MKWSSFSTWSSPHYLKSLTWRLRVTDNAWCYPVISLPFRQLTLLVLTQSHIQSSTSTFTLSERCHCCIIDAIEVYIQSLSLQSCTHKGSLCSDIVNWKLGFPFSHHIMQTFSGPKVYACAAGVGGSGKLGWACVHILHHNLTCPNLSYSNCPELLLGATSNEWVCVQVLTHHSAGNLVGKGDQVNRPQLSQGTVRLFIGGGDLWEWRGWANAPVAEQGAVRGWCHGSHGSGGTMVDVFIAMALEGLRRWQLKVAGAILQ